MKNEYRLSKVAKKYLNTFYDILDEMIQGMTNVELTDSISHNFILQMIPHHMAAIEMSHNILKYTTFIPLEDIASNIISEQTKSIENMKNVLHRCSELENTKQDVFVYQQRFNKITQTMFSKMRKSCATNNINSDFMREMIPHHMGAIEMSNNVLSYKICPELKPIIESIIVSQREGVKNMQCLLKHL